MGLMDVDGFGDDEPIELDLKKTMEMPTFVENPFSAADTGDVNNLIKFHVINSKYNMGNILKNYLHMDIGAVNVYCPFHNDEETGKPSAKYYPKSDTLYCYSEGRSYTAYHAMKLIGINTDKVFQDIWKGLYLDEKQSYIDKYGECGNAEQAKVILPDEWTKYRGIVLDMFRQGKVNFHQHKVALFKILTMVSKTEGERRKVGNSSNA